MSSKQQVTKSKDTAPHERRLKPKRNSRQDKIVTRIDRQKLREVIRIVSDEHTINVEAKSSRGWAVKRVGGKMESKDFLLKAEAIKYGRLLCKQTDSSLVIYSKDGKILESKRHGIVRQRASRKSVS